MIEIHSEEGRAVLAALGVREVGQIHDLEGELINQDKRSWVKRFDLAEQGLARYYLKAFSYLGRPQKNLRYFLQASHCRRESRNLRLLSRLKIGAPEVLAEGELRNFGFPRQAFVLSREIEGANQLDLGLNAGELNHQECLELTRILSEQVATMHNFGYVDRDLKYRNILFRRCAEGLEVFHLDSTMGRVCRGRFLREGIIHDLATLDKYADRYLSPRERMGFLIHYARKRGLTGIDRRNLARATEARRRELMARLNR